MFERISEFWNNYGLEFLAGISLAIILILFVVNYFTKDKGTYSKMKFVNNPETFQMVPETTHYMEHTEKDSKLELKAKFILESIFKRPFVKIRPMFLQNDVTGQNLEIDLFNEELQLGFEINGDQHYKFTPFFHRNKDAFLNQRYRDEMKKEKCKQNGITLIEVPYKVGEKNLKSFIVDKLRLEGYLL